MSNIRSFNESLRAEAFLFRGAKKLGVRVINKTGSSIATDKLVAITGYDVTSGRPKVVLADADVAGHEDVYVTSGSIADSSEGYVYKGMVSAANLNTNSATTVGDPVYLSTTAGAFTVTAPSVANAIVLPVGFVAVKSATVGQIFWNIGPIQKAGSNQVQSGVESATLVATGSISSANITGTSSGQLGHANGVELVAAGGTHVINQLVYAVLINDFSVAAYTGGGNTTINIGSGGAALTGLVSNANFIQAGADKVIEFVPLAATFNTYTENKGINLVTASAPTQPGTAAGVFRYIVGYRQLSTGL